VTQKTVTLVVPDGYATGEEFAKDCGFEIVRPESPAWDAPWNRQYPPVEFRAAEIYAILEYNGPGTKPAWMPYGNSTKQDEARQQARRELRAGGHMPVTSQERTAPGADDVGGVK